MLTNRLEASTYLWVMMQLYKWSRITVPEKTYVELVIQCYYGLHDPDSIILGDEMGFPYESLLKYIKFYDIVGAAANPWVKSYGKEKRVHSSLFFFTGGCRKLGVWFIFKGEFGKTLDKSCSSWCEELHCLFLL